ncbi:MAG: glycosyltransferase [Candidatus Limnocylindrales bacterium]
MAIVTHSYYEEDPRVRRQAESLVAAGWAVDVYALRRAPDAPEGALEGVAIRRLDVQRHQGAGLGTYFAEYCAFFARATMALARAHRQRRYQLVQVATIPDWLVFAALPERLTGAPLVLDLHEAMPEFFRSRFPRAANPVAHGLLRLQERVSLAAATHLLTVNDALRERLLRLGVPRDRVTVILNSPSLARFDPAALPRREFMADGTLRLAYAGAVTPMYELDVALDGLARLRATRPSVRLALEVYGRGDSQPALERQAARLGLSDAVTFHGRIPL